MIYFWVKTEPPFLFSYIVTSMVLCPVITNSSFALFFTVKGEKLCPLQDFHGWQPKIKDFPGPGIFFSNSRTFQDF